MALRIETGEWDEHQVGLGQSRIRQRFEQAERPLGEFLARRPEAEMQRFCRRCHDGKRDAVARLRQRLQQRPGRDFGADRPVGRNDRASRRQLANDLERAPDDLFRRRMGLRRLDQVATGERMAA